MKQCVRFGGMFSLLLFCLSAARAHYSMLMPVKHAVKKGEAVTLTYQWGHAFEHQLSDAPKPESVFVLSPDGKKTDLTKSLEKDVEMGEKNKPTIYNFRFTPGERGDYVFVLRTPPIWMEEEHAFVQDLVKVVVHVQSPNEWDAYAQEDLEMVPLTRPYGLQAGMVFQAQVRERFKSDGKPVPKVLVECERYNAKMPKELPPDEQITRAAKTDPNGVVTCTLTDPGWWCVAAQREGGKKEREGKTYPVRQRAIHWIYVDDKPAAKK
jgi:cobalt/nickel transport protein